MSYGKWLYLQLMIVMLWEHVFLRRRVDPLFGRGCGHAWLANGKASQEQEVSTGDLCTIMYSKHGLELISHTHTRLYNLPQGLTVHMAWRKLEGFQLIGETPANKTMWEGRRREGAECSSRVSEPIALRLFLLHCSCKENRPGMYPWEWEL